MTNTPCRILNWKRCGRGRGLFQPPNLTIGGTEEKNENPAQSDQYFGRNSKFRPPNTSHERLPLRHNGRNVLIMMKLVVRYSTML